MNEKYAQKDRNKWGGGEREDWMMCKEQIC